MNDSGSQRLLIKNGSLPINFITSYLSSVKATNSQIKFDSLRLVDDEGAFSGLSFVLNKMYLEVALENRSIKGLFISPLLLKDMNELDRNIAFLLSDSPMEDFYKLHNYLYTKTNFYGKKILKDPVIPKSCNVSPSAIINNGVIMGENCVIKERCVIKSGTIMGDDVVIKEGAIVGAEITEIKMIGGKNISIKHDSNVIINDEVEIGINSIVSRGILGQSTIIGNGTRVCDQVFVSHRCQIGENSFIASGVNISGSSIIGDNVWIGPGAVISNGIKIEDGADITIGSVVVDKVSAGEKVTGNFAIPHMKFMLDWMRSKKKK
jgi:UDP-3-O-[3-hydroxymyristoyl] glucosamine N-acyltransferase